MELQLGTMEHCTVPIVYSGQLYSTKLRNCNPDQDCDSSSLLLHDFHLGMTNLYNLTTVYEVNLTTTFDIAFHRQSDLHFQCTPVLHLSVCILNKSIDIPSSQYYKALTVISTCNTRYQRYMRLSNIYIYIYIYIYTITHSNRYSRSTHQDVCSCDFSILFRISKRNSTDILRKSTRT